MSYFERLAAQDTKQLIRIAAALSFMLTDTVGLSYNLALMLFGLVAVELSTTGCEQFFLSMDMISGIFDLLSIASPMPGVVSRIVALIVLFLKVPIYLSGVVHLRERGGDLTWSSRGFAPAGWMPAGMPGGGGGGQTLGTGPVPSAAPAPPGSFPSGGYRLGGDEANQPRGQTTRDGYEAIA